MQSEVGCPADFDPSCAATHLAYDASVDVWQKTLSMPAGSYSYLAAINDSFTEVYGAHAVRSGANIPLTAASASNIKFYYDAKTNWITDNVNPIMAVLFGSFQSELGCTADFDPSCLRSWLEDIDGDGIYSFSALLPAGSYDAKIAINESFDENYGQGGVAGGLNITFVSDGRRTMRFEYCSVTHLLGIGASCGPHIYYVEK